MAPAFNDIQVRFIRRVHGDTADTNPNRDDILKLSRKENNLFRLTYTEKSEDGVVVDVMYYSYQEVISYFYRIFWLLKLDEDPFRSVQFFIPGYPVYLVHVDAIKDNMSYLLEIIMATCWSWPESSAELNEPERVSSHRINIE